MAGFENTIVFSSGEKLSPSSSDDISRMQENSTDVSRINHTGNPEGAVSANPGSLCHDPVSGIIYYKATGTGNTGWNSLVLPAGNVVIATPVISGIDFTQTGNTLIYTPPSDFIVQSIVKIIDDETGYIEPGAASLGSNNPDYNNVSGVDGVSLIPNGLGVFLQYLSDSFSVVSSGDGIYLHIGTGVSATTCSGRVFLTGILI